VALPLSEGIPLSEEVPLSEGLPRSEEDAPHAAPPRINRLRLVPIGRLSEGIAEQLQQAIASELGITCDVGDYLPRPLTVYIEERHQFCAVRLLERLARERKDPRMGLLALIDGDLHLAPYNFTFGHADRYQGVALLSQTRLHPDCYGEPESDERLFARILAEALHQIGILLGLAPCEDPSCPMCLANGIGDVDRKLGHYQGDCARFLGIGRS
jgi:predicted Zn-dependent protease